MGRNIYAHLADKMKEETAIKPLNMLVFNLSVFTHKKEHKKAKTLKNKGLSFL